MDLAALILSIVSLFMSGTVMVIYLAKNVFSSHTIQMVPADSLTSAKPLPIGKEFEEFDAPSAMDVAIEQALSKTQH